MKYKLLLLLFVVPFVTSFAQRVQVTTFRRVAGDSTKTKSTTSYFGVQANQLLNQLFNFGNSSPSINNPYLLTYSLNSNQTGVGLNSGLGYTVHSTDEKSDPNTTRKSTISSFSIRAGIEKKSFIGKKWLASYGFDLLYNNEDDNTTTSTSFQGNSNSTGSVSNTSYFGFGPRFALNFVLSERILLGTEATYYFKSITVSQTIKNTSTFQVFDPNTGQTTNQTTSSETHTSQNNADFVFNVPVSIFLIVKF